MTGRALDVLVKLLRDFVRHGRFDQLADLQLVQRRAPVAFVTVCVLAVEHEVATCNWERSCCVLVCGYRGDVRRLRRQHAAARDTVLLEVTKDDEIAVVHHCTAQRVTLSTIAEHFDGVVVLNRQHRLPEEVEVVTRTRTVHRTTTAKQQAILEHGHHRDRPTEELRRRTAHCITDSVGLVVWMLATGRGQSFETRAILRNVHSARMNHSLREHARWLLQHTNAFAPDHFCPSGTHVVLGVRGQVVGLAVTRALRTNTHHLADVVDCGHERRCTHFLTDCADQRVVATVIGTDVHEVSVVNYDRAVLP